MSVADREKEPDLSLSEKIVLALCLRPICVRTLLVYLILDGYQELWHGDPGMLENVGHHYGCGIPPRKRSAVGKV